MPPKWQGQIFQLNFIKNNFFCCYKLINQVIKQHEFIRFKINILIELKNSYYQINCNFIKCFFILFFLLNICLLNNVNGLKYERELSYLEYYMGIAPADVDGNIYVNGKIFLK